MKSKRHYGFSLLETVVYIGILATVAGIFTGVFQSILRTQISETSQNEITSQLNFAVQTIQRLVKNSSVIEFDGCGATTTLSLIMPQEAYSPTSIYAQNSKLYIQQGSGTAQTLTSDTVTVDSLEFKKLCNTGAKDTIEIHIAISKLDASTNDRISRSLTSAISRVNAVTFDSSLLPPTDATYDVGTWPTLRWRNGAFSGQVKAGQLCIADDCQSSWSSASQWSATGTNIYYNDGNVGIGTTEPGTLLHIPTSQTGTSITAGSLANGVVLALGNSSATINNIAAIGFSGSATGIGDWVKMGAQFTDRTGSSEDADFFISTIAGGSASEKFRITSTGNVGIGTTTPSNTLTVNGDIGFADGTTLSTAYPTRGATLNISTSTLAAYSGTSATSTIELGFAYRPQTFVNAKCVADAGSFAYRIGDGTNWSNTLSCTTSSTSFNDFTTNNTFTQGEARYIQVGSFSSFSKSSLTIGIQDTAD